MHFALIMQTRLIMHFLLIMQSASITHVRVRDLARVVTTRHVINAVCMINR